MLAGEQSFALTRRTDKLFSTREQDQRLALAGSNSSKMPLAIEIAAIGRSDIAGAPNMSMGMPP